MPARTAKCTIAAMSLRSFVGALILGWVIAPGVASAEEPEFEEFRPTSSKAPDAEPLESVALEEEDAPELEDEDEVPETREDPAKRRRQSLPANRHGIGFRGGITVVPTWIFNRWAEAHTNALCRGENVGSFAAQRGLLKSDGCNFYTGGEYVYRQSRVFDIVGSIGYQRFHAPDGFWLDESGAADASLGGGNPLGGADYTEIKLDMLYFEADFIARAPIIVTDNVEFGIGGGAGVGLGILFGGVYQTPIGADPRGFTPQGGPQTGSCQTVADLADFTRCTPRWDAGQSTTGVPPNSTDLVTPNADLFATCSRDECAKGDLQRFGYRTKNDKVPPVLPVVNLIISARVIVKDVLGITVNGGFNSGFYFGGGLTYFFGSQFSD